MSATAIFPSADPVAPLLSGKNGTAASTDEEHAFAALLGGGSVSDIVLASLARQAAPDARLQESGIAERPLDPATPPPLAEPKDQSRPPQQADTNRPAPEESALRSSEDAAIASSSNRAVPDEQKSGRTVPTTQSNGPTDQPATAQPRAAAAAAQPQTPAGPNSALRAQVTDAPTELVSQPSNTLSANAAVVAQKAANSRGANAAAVEPTAGLAAQNAQQRALGNGPAARTPGKLASDAAAAKATAQNSQSAPAPAIPATEAFNAMLATQAAATPQPGSANSFARAEQAVLASNGSTGQPVARQTTNPAPVQLPKPPVPPRLVTNQVAVQIQKAAAQGSDRINIQLKPAELGRVEVQMDVAKDGRVTAVISAERSETLDLLQRDARALQNALNDAGLRTDSDSLSFNLKGQNQAQEDGEQSAGQSNGDGALGDETDRADGSGPTARQDILTNDRVDIEV
jgi:flagellar hook-length control protein FliK